ncbi:MAG: hypothetical protein A2046_12740 [Bacteroidetes bacterium GWA2_30_7]|nr:MAG: hypothetical protein A2046_12740 [Bacteroidetes bacterium GWA2_30_7]
MDLQTRKLNIIEYLIGLQDDKVFSKIESAILGNKKQDTQKVKSLTQKNLIDRANRSNEDYKAGKVKTQDQLEKESENW